MAEHVPLYKCCSRVSSITTTIHKQDSSQHRRLRISSSLALSFVEERVISERKLAKEMGDETSLHHCCRRRRHLPDTYSSSPTDVFPQKTSHCNNKKDHVDRFASSGKLYPLVSYKELPDYMKDNEYILNYYRADWPVKEAFFSILRWHNETLNVWTHLIGFLLFLALTLTNLMHVQQVADLFGMFTWSAPASAETNVSHNFNDDNNFIGTQIFIHLKHIVPFNVESTVTNATYTARWPFFVFLGGSMFCLLTSSICHLFSCHSHHLNILLLRFDYVGITVMIITSFFPQIYYVFQCEPQWQAVYIGGITAMGLFTIVTLLTPALSTGKRRGFRAMLFCSMGLFGIVPAIHAVVVNWGNPERNVTLVYEAAMALSYLTGTLFYVLRIPERWKPGWFDLAGHSHQIFHILVVMGALAHYVATLILLEWRAQVGCGLA